MHSSLNLNLTDSNVEERLTQGLPRVSSFLSLMTTIFTHSCCPGPPVCSLWVCTKHQCKFPTWTRTSSHYPSTGLHSKPNSWCAVTWLYDVLCCVFYSPWDTPSWAPGNLYHCSTCHYTVPQSVYLLCECFLVTLLVFVLCLFSFHLLLPVSALAPPTLTCSSCFSPRCSSMWLINSPLYSVLWSGDHFIHE